MTAETSNTVSVIDLAADKVVHDFLANVRPRAAAFAPDGKHAYITNEVSGTLDIVNVATHEVAASVEIEQGLGKPVGVVVSPDGRRVYIANGATSTVAVSGMPLP